MKPHFARLVFVVMAVVAVVVAGLLLATWFSMALLGPI
jgi:hypothetical protein